MLLPAPSLRTVIFWQVSLLVLKHFKLFHNTLHFGFSKLKVNLLGPLINPCTELQWMNQSHNAAVNYSNRNASKVSKHDIPSSSCTHNLKK